MELFKRRREEVERTKAEEEILKNFEKVRRVGRSPTKGEGKETTSREEEMATKELKKIATLMQEVKEEMVKTRKENANMTKAF